MNPWKSSSLKSTGSPDRCEFKEMKDELIRDRLVVGILDQALSERLEMEADLTLDKAKRMIRQREAVKTQQEALRGKEKAETSLLAIARNPPRRKLPAVPQTKITSSILKPPVFQICRRCGKGSHPLQDCPAKDATCFHCNRKGHFGNQRLSTTVANVKRDLSELTMESDNNNDDTDRAYLDTVRGEQSRIWVVDVKINDRTVSFKVDTGAEVTAISEPTWSSLGITTPLAKAKTLLFGPDQRPLEVVGKAPLPLAYNQKTCVQTVYIIKGLKNNLLGLPAIIELKFLSNVCSVEKSIVSQYPALFTGLGSFSQEYEIKIKPNSQPFALCTPRHKGLGTWPGTRHKEPGPTSSTGAKI